MDGLTTQIAEFAAQLQYGDLPEEVIQTARVRIADAIGCALGGSASPTRPGSWPFRWRRGAGR